MKPAILGHFQIRIKNKEKLFIEEVYGMAKVLFSKCIELFNIYKMVHLVS